jgi:hypothetical protein
MKVRVGVLAMALAASTVQAAGGGDEDWTGIDPFELHPTSLKAVVKVNAHCDRVWDVLTVVEKLKILAPHLNITSPVERAHERGDYVNTIVDKGDHTAKGKFILTSPVPNERVSAIVQPDDGPWMRVQVWTMSPTGPDSCRMDYSEAYNEEWLIKQRIDGTDFIAKNRDHHIHVVLRRVKNIAEGKKPGSDAEYKYLFADAKDFPKQFQRPKAQAKN